MPPSNHPSGNQKTVHPLIQNAVKSLQTAVAHEQQKRSLSPQQRRVLRQTLQHAVYWFESLSLQQSSLQAGIDCFHQHVWPRVLPQLNDRKQQQLLQHVLSILIRFRDGLILCVSGECRHESDKKAKRPFSSHLAKGAKTGNDDNTSSLTRPDGYTKLYDPNLVYSGTGWDEWVTPKCGLLARLARSLQVNPEKWADRLYDRYPAVELALQSLETKQTQIQAALGKTLGEKLKHDLEQRPAVVKRVQWNLHQDKMESCRIVWADGTRVEWGRRGAEFQLSEPVLPLHCQTAADWRPSLELPVIVGPPTKKRRRRIVDEDDSSQQVPKLQVKIQNQPDVKASALDQAVETSVTALKQQFGVNPQSLEQSRQVLEAEEAVATAAARAIDLDTCVPLQQGERSPEEAAQQVRCLEKVLRRLKTSHNQPQPETLWDARETLRCAAMEAGNAFLWRSDDKENTNVPVTAKLDDYNAAARYFRRALELVQQQQQAMGQDDARFIQRNLWYLLGQAQTNLGIARLKCKQRPRALKLLRQAILATQRVVSIAKEHASSDDGAAPSNDAHEDLLRGLQLQSMAYRWLGVTLWEHTPQDPDQPMETMALAAQAYQHASETSDPEHSLLYLDLRVECYSAWTTLVDLASHALEKASSSKELQQGDKVLELARCALGKARPEAEWLQRHCQQVRPHDAESYCRESGIVSPEYLSQIATDLEQWWNERKTAQQSHLLIDRSKAVNIPPTRSDVAVDTATSRAPTRRLLLRAPVKRRRNKYDGALNGSYSNFGPINTDDEVATAPTQQQFRPWGDALLPQRLVNGQPVPILPEPCRAPTIPTELVAMALRLGITIPKDD